MKTKIAIIGAGPSGLTQAHALLRRGVGDFIVLERAEDAGGLCRTRSNFVPGARGRWGEWQHYNTDVVVERALALAERIAS